MPKTVNSAPQTLIYTEKKIESFFKLTAWLIAVPILIFLLYQETNHFKNWLNNFSPFLLFLYFLIFLMIISLIHSLQDLFKPKKHAEGIIEQVETSINMPKTTFGWTGVIKLTNDNNIYHLGMASSLAAKQYLRVGQRIFITYKPSSKRVTQILIQ